MHHGVKGQRWGVRRYQNEDGSYTDAGRKRRASGNKANSGRSSHVQTGRRIGKNIGRVAGAVAVAESVPLVVEAAKYAPDMAMVSGANPALAVGMVAVGSIGTLAVTYAGSRCCGELLGAIGGKVVDSLGKVSHKS